MASRSIRGNPRLALAAVGLATFMTSLDQYVRQSMTATPQVSGYRGATGMVRSNQVDRAAPRRTRCRPSMSRQPG